MKIQPLDTGERTPELSEQTLIDENHAYRKTDGVSKINRSQGFIPAFYDKMTGKVARSCYSNGRPAPFHMIEGVPTELVAERDCQGRVVRLKTSVISGFLMGGIFYTRDEAASASAH